MPRRKLIRTSDYPYHVTTRSNSKEWFNIPTSECWSICIELLEKAQKDFKIELHAFVLMSNHYHMIIRTPECDIDRVMQFFNKMLSTRINMSTGRVNHVFGTPYKWSIIDNEIYYANALKYLYQNPVRAGLVSDVHAYPYSTLNQKNCKNLLVTCYLVSLDPQWLNEMYADTERDRIKKGLKRAKFRPSYDLKTRRNVTLM